MRRKGGDMQLTELITVIAKALVDNPDQVTVNEVASSQTSIIELTVAKSDLGQVIGRQGRMANALRTILLAVSTKQRRRSTLEIIEPESRDPDDHSEV